LDVYQNLCEALIIGYNINLEETMLGEQIEAVFDNGVFRPLKPVNLPEHQRVTVMLPSEEEVFDGDVGYEPLPLQDCMTIRVRIKIVDDFGLIPY
jgi:predicted DNA-binding antitoxin AbrB/MazE fold protein